MKKAAKILLPILFVTTLFYLPILANPNLVLERGNDLQEFFWPIYLFVKKQILENNTFPLWNNLFLSGTPLLPDPQAPLFYLPNIIFLLLPIGMGFIASMFLHTLVGGVGAYLVSRRGFGFSKNASFFSAALYILTSRTAAYLEAGHFGLVAATAWVPFALLAVVMLAKKPAASWSALLAISLAGLFYTHSLTFVYSAILTTAFLVITIFLRRKRTFIKSFAFFTLGAAITFGLIAISFLPQIEWAGQTSRVALTSDRQVWPKWHSLGEFVQAVLAPWLQGLEKFRELDTEKWITLGIIPSILAVYGFLKTRKRAKIALSILALAVVLIALNNASPLYEFLISQDWFIYTRVATRVWFVLGLITTFLAAYGYQTLEMRGGKKIIKVLAALAIIELLIISWIRISKPIDNQPKYVSRDVLEFLSADKDQFRVFCLNRCIRQIDAASFGLELVEGYSTLIQINYYQHAWQLTGGYWDYYTLAIPPIGAYKFEDLQPDATSLGQYNTKYVISPHELTDENFALEKKFGDYLVYSNELVKPRATSPITFYSPNSIRVDTRQTKESSVTLSEVYSPGWKAYLNGKEKVLVLETPIALRAVDVRPDTRFVDFKYQPESYIWGRTITFSTVFFLIGYGVKTRLLER